MSRLTGSDALGLFEAYKAVYVPQELTEEQIWEEVENWVNSLLEEGYDLSDYTWEEMYESYLNEMGQTRTTGQNSSVFTLPQTPSAGSAGGSGSGGRRGSGSNPSVRYSTPNPSFQQSGGFGRYAAPSAQVKTPTPAARPAPAAGTPARSASAPAKPAAAPARSASAPATPKPTPTASASSTPSAKPSAMDQWAKANPRLAQAQQIRQQGGSRAEVNKALYNKGTAAAEKTPTVVKASFDMFDVIKGHLLDEGYADTEESAIAIMANMSEEWRQSIVEGSAAMSANVPSGRTVKMTASGKEPAGDALVRRAGESIGKFFGSKGKVQSTTAQPRKPLISTSKPGPSNNFGRGF